MTNRPGTKCASLFSTTKYGIDSDGPIVAAYRLKTPENMGHIIRVASNFGCSKVLFVGDQPVRQDKLKKVAGAAAGQVSWLFCNEKEWRNHVPEDYNIVAIETVQDSENLTQSKLPKKIVFWLGNEIDGLPVEILDQCSNYYHIPMIGVIKSMNVSHACSVALYEWLRQHVK